MNSPFYLNTTPLFNPGRVVRVNTLKVKNTKPYGPANLKVWILETSVPLDGGPVTGRVQLDAWDVTRLFWWFLKSLLF